MDAIRSTAIILMIVVHVTAPLLSEFPSRPTWWWIGNIFDSLARPCVPLFFMLSGALLLSVNKSEPLGVFFGKRFRRVVIPFTVWQIIYIAWRVMVHHEDIDTGNITATLLNGPSYYHLWFVWVLLGLYLATPILRVFIQAATERDLRYFLLLWLCANSLVPLLSRFSAIHINITFFVTVGYVGYFVLGYYIERGFMSATARRWLPLAAAVSLLVIILGTYQLMLRNGGELDQFFYDYLNLAVVVVSAFVFVFMKTLGRGMQGEGDAAGARLVTLVSSASFGIYLIHIIVLEVLAHGFAGTRINASLIHPIVGVPVTTVLVLGCSTVAVLLLRRTPVLRHIV